MNELEIIRLNVDRYRRMLQIEVDETARQAIKNILEEFEAKLAKAAAPLTHVNDRSSAGRYL
jgi:histone H3/H4